MATYPEYCIGFSDHTIGTEIPLAAVALGASIIEKHFTLDKNMEGWDHKISATTEEMAIIVQGATRISDALGSFRVAANESDEKKIEFRRSIVLIREFRAGEVIATEDIDYKRPGTGLKPEMTEFVVGLKVTRNLLADHILTKEDLS
jgi:N-acetylneuraminate synthase